MHTYAKHDSRAYIRYHGRRNAFAGEWALGVCGNTSDDITNDGRRTNRAHTVGASEASQPLLRVRTRGYQRTMGMRPAWKAMYKGRSTNDVSANATRERTSRGVSSGACQTEYRLLHEQRHGVCRPIFAYAGKWSYNGL